MDFDWSVIAGALPALARGARLTVFITVAGLVGGTLLGVLFGLMRAYGTALSAASALPMWVSCAAHLSWCRSCSSTSHCRACWACAWTR